MSRSHSPRVASSGCEVPLRLWNRCRSDAASSSLDVRVVITSQPEGEQRHSRGRRQTPDRKYVQVIKHTETDTYTEGHTERHIQRQDKTDTQTDRDVQRHIEGDMDTCSVMSLTVLLMSSSDLPSSTMSRSTLQNSRIYIHVTHTAMSVSQLYEVLVPASLGMRLLS